MVEEDRAKPETLRDSNQRPVPDLEYPRHEVDYEKGKRPAIQIEHRGPTLIDSLTHSKSNTKDFTSWIVVDRDQLRADPPPPPGRVQLLSLASRGRPRSLPESVLWCCNATVGRP